MIKDEAILAAQLMQLDEAKVIFQEWRERLTEDEISDDKLGILAGMSARRNTFAINTLRKIFEAKINRICNQHHSAKPEGNVQILIEYKDGQKEEHLRKNTILRDGKAAIAKCLANEVADPFDFYIESMIFGTNGTSGGTPKFVDETREGLFGTTLLTKNVISSIEDAAPTTAIFTSVISYSEANGETLNEMALKMANSELYSMITFPDLNKTSSMQLTINWEIAIL